MRASLIAAILIIASSIIVAASATKAATEKSIFLNSSFSIYFKEEDAQRFWKRYGMLLNGSEFTAEILITPTNYSKELVRTALLFNSYFIDKGVEPAVLIDGRNVEYHNPLSIEHPEKIGEIKVLLTAKAEDNVTVRTPITLIKIIQHTSEGEYVVENREVNMSSWIIEKAIALMEQVKEKIERARDVVSGFVDAENALRNAESQLMHASDLYMQGKPEEAMEEAKNALDNVEIALERAESVRSMGDVMKYVVIAVVIIIAAVVTFALFNKRRRERGKLG